MGQGMHYHTDVCTGDQRTTLAREHGQVQQEPWRLVFDRLGNAGALRRCSHLRPLALLHPIPSADACFWSRNPTKGFHAYKFSSCTRPRSAPSCSSCVAKAHHLPEILLPLLPSTSHQCDLGAHSLKCDSQISCCGREPTTFPKSQWRSLRCLLCVALSVCHSSFFRSRISCSYCRKPTSLGRLYPTHKWPALLAPLLAANVLAPQDRPRVVPAGCLLACSVAGQ